METNVPSTSRWVRLRALGARLAFCPRLLRRRDRELDTLLEIKPRLSSRGPGRRKLQEVVDVTELNLDYRYGAVLLMDRGTGRLEPVALSKQGRDEEFLERDREYVRSCNPRPEAGITGWVFTHGEPVLSGDVRTDSRYVAVRSEVRSELCVPIRIDGHSVGVINVESPRLHAFGEDDLRFLTLLAQDIASAVQLRGIPVSREAGARPVAETVPICSSCHKCRTERGNWLDLESYFFERDVVFSHGLCPECAERVGAKD